MLAAPGLEPAWFDVGSPASTLPLTLPLTRMQGLFPDPPRDDRASPEPVGPVAEEDGSLERVEAGGIPLSAERRLARAAATGASFSSGLSVGEFALSSQLGLRVLAQVLGASVFQVATQYLPSLEPRRNVFALGPYDSPYAEPSLAQKRAYEWDETVICELTTISQAWEGTRRRAFDRMSEEAEKVGADTVLGVQLQRGEHDWGRGTIDYLISGTAVSARAAGSAPRWPVLSNLSVQDYWRLLEAGYEPVGMLAASAVVFASASRSVRLGRMRAAQKPQHLEELSSAFNAAWDAVRARLAGQVDAHNGAGAVGVRIVKTVREETLSLESSVQPSYGGGWQGRQAGLPAARSSEIEREGWVVSMHAAGTAVRATCDPPRYPPEKVLRLSGA